MAHSLRVLILEDNADDCDLVVRELRRGGYEVDWERVNDAAAMASALSRKPWDLILSDFSLPTCSALEALALYKQHGLDIPFIIVSGSIDEAHAVEALKAGAHDFVTKHNFARLCPAIARECREAATRRRHREAETQFKAARERQEQEILEQRTFLRQVIDINPHLIFVKDREGRFTLVNQAVADAYGTTVEGLLGKSDGDFNSDTEEVEHFRRDDIAVMDSRTERVVPDEPLTDAKGTRRWLHTVKRPFVGADNIANQIIGVATDITERKRAEEALQASERSFRRLFAANPLPMWVFDLETLRFLEVNDAAIVHYGYSRDEFLGMRLTDIRPLEDVPALMDDLDRRGDVDATLKPKIWRHRLKDGRAIEVEIASHNLEFDGRPGVLVVAHDVTERQQLQRQLLQAQKMEAIGQLAGGVAHDFNNLLGVITGTTELLLASLAPDHPGRRRAEQTLKAAERAAGLTRQLLTFSRKQIVNPHVLDLNRVVPEMTQMLRRLIGEDIDLRSALAPDLARIKADPGEIEQVIMNLAVNARDAMPNGGRLTIETQNVMLEGAYVEAHVEVAAGRYVMLAVSDTGTGIPPEIQARIFEPFFTTKEVGKGTGLGLSTVYGIVKQSGGQVLLYSEPEHGTTFKVYFPVVEAAAEKPAEMREPTIAAGTETVLLVEDEATLRMLVSEVLQDCGYTILEAQDGMEALRVSEEYQGPIDVLMTDVVMPNMGGRELAERISARRPDTKMIFLSGYTDDAVVRHGVLSADVAFLQKPFSSDALRQKIRTVLDGCDTTL
jgi:two-component system cell cycle sensor histidine kinase/response regulator CckA